MKSLPSPEVYQKEFTYMPWGFLVQKVLQYITKHAPKNGAVLDLMCGPGYQLSKIHKQRPDLQLTGVDIDARYIRHARKRYAGITFHKADSMTWKSAKQFDVILCTAGLHHVPYSQHANFLKKISRLVRKNGVCIVADPYIAPYRTEKERRIAAAELVYAYLRAVLYNKAPDDVVEATIDIMYNDILPRGEYKTYVKCIDTLSRRFFRSVRCVKTWPRAKSEYGDYIFFLRQPK